MKVEIPEHLRERLGPEMKMDTHWIDAKLADGRIYRGLVVKGGRYITGFKDDPNGEGEIPFESKDVEGINRENSPLYLLSRLFPSLSAPR